VNHLIQSLDLTKTLSQLNSSIIKEDKDVYSFPLLTESYCQKITNEIENFLNTTRDSGIALAVSSFGFDGTVYLISEYISPLIRYLYPQLKNTKLGIYPKLMTYRMGKNEDWPVHTDGDLATLNICLGKQWEGTDLRLFNSDKSQFKDYKHQIGRAVILLGDNLHSVTPLLKGTRFSLIVKINQSK